MDEEAVLMDSILCAHINELKGYVDACLDVMGEEGCSGGIPWSMLETIQKKVDVISLAIKEPVDP
jgi:hypothetical protein